ncbi:MAG TPA: hypothetical protein VG456_18090 [Candidatus Sulfopaludibacter sp.]|nr:hypothetical protein [Candidatus Sulfopaludibacter sp.]
MPRLPPVPDSDAATPPCRSEGLAGLPETQGIQAIDPSTGKPMWKHGLAENSLASGVLATAGGLVFAASRTGRTLWHFQAGGDGMSPPTQYRVNEYSVSPAAISRY